MTEETIFTSALEISNSAERDAYLASACGGDPGLRRRVDALLHAHKAADSFLESPLAMPPDAETIGLGKVGTTNSDVASRGKIRYVGDYELLEEVGRGGMGIVYKARQASLNRVVALKMILAGQLANDADIRRFRAEAEAAAKLDHPGIVHVFEVGTHEGHQYFSMAFVEGESLAHKIAQGLMPPRQAAELTRKVADAVSFAHVEGVIHRDLKPGNILIDKNGQPRLTDFGLAKRLASEPGVTAVAGLTMTGQVLGTPSYMPPEQATGQASEVGPRSDIYSLGAVLYCLLTGRPPFQSDNPLDTLLQVVQMEPVSPRRLNTSVPRDLETICLKCLAKEPRKRYASAQELSADLERFVMGQPIKARPLGPIGRGWRWCRRNPALATAAGVAAAALFLTVILAVSFGVYQWNIGERDRRLLAESYYDKGQSFCEQGDIARGMLWLARSLETAPASAGDLQRASRTNLGAWYVPSARLQKVFEHPQGTTTGFSPVRLRPDGQVLLAQENNGTVRLWDLATGAVKKEFFPNGRQHSGAFSPDGTLFVHGGPDEDRPAGVVATIRDTVTGQPVRTLKIRREDIPMDGRAISASKTAFSPDGKIIATASYFRNVQLWDAATGTPIGPLLGPFPDGLHKDDIMALALSPDNTRVATASRDSTARIWDVRTGKPLCEPLNHGHFWLRVVAFSPDGKTLLTAGDTPPRLWDTATGKQIGEPLPVGTTYGVAFSPDGRLFLTGSGNSSQLWDAATRKPVGLAMNHGCYDGTVTFGADGKTFATAGSGAICVWDVPKSPPGETVATAAGPIIAAVYSPVGDVFATASYLSIRDRWNGVVQFWNSQTAKPLGEPVEVKQGLRSIAFSPDGKTLAAIVDVGFKRLNDNSGEPAWEVRIWNVADRQPAGPVIELWGHPGTIAFGSNGATLITTDESRAWNNRQGMVRTWDIATGKIVGEPRPKTESMTDDVLRPEHPGPHGKRMRVVHAGDNILFLSDVAANKGFGQIYASGGVGPIAVSSDGAFLVTGGEKSQQLWDTASQKPIGTPREPAAAVAFSPDSKTILTGGSDGNIRLRTIPTPIEGDIDRIGLWVEVLTNSTLDRGSPARAPFTVRELSRRQERLDKLGGPPAP